MNQKNSIFFETMLMRGGKIPLWAYHYRRVEKTWRYFFPEIPVPSSTDLLTAINNQISISCNEMKIRLELGLNYTSIIIDEFKSETQKSSKIKKLAIYHKEKIENINNNFKITERSLYNNSLKFAKEQNADQAIILDSNNNIIETSIANILFVKNYEIHTPSLINGGIEGVYRSFIKDRISKSKKWVWIEKKIPLEDANKYDKILIINALRGLNYAKII